MNRFLITQSLLSNWLWLYKTDDRYEDFIKSLNREPIQQTTAMLDGNRFENVLCATLNGATIDQTHEWYKPIMELYPILHGAQQQVAVSKNIVIDGTEYVLYGVLDFLKEGIIYDTKYSKTYSVGKYLDSPQHPMYLALVPEAREFQYKICDSKYIYTETYRHDEVEPIEQTIKHFIQFLKEQKLTNIYRKKWRSKY